MTVISRNLLSASQQFLSAAKPTLLSPRAKMIVSTALIALSAISAITTPTPSQAQSGYGANGSGYGANGSGYGGNVDQSALSASSAGRWGELLGGVMGRAVGTLASGASPVGDLGRRMQEVSSGVGEVGRNLGRNAAQKPYDLANSEADGRSPHAISMALANMPAIERDYLDTLGVNAIFAYSTAALASSGSPTYSSAINGRESAARDFELALRSVAERGFSIAPWAEVRTALQQPVRSVPEARFVQYGQVMTQRLHRPGGPGYVVPQSYLNAQQAQQQNYAPPVQQRGYANPAPAQPQVQQQVITSVGCPSQQVAQVNPQAQQYQQAPRPNSLEAMRASMNGMLKPVTSADRP